MKQTILFIALLVCGQLFAQQTPKSEQIAKEIQSLELENNNLILNEYIKEQCDTTSKIMIESLSKKIVEDFQLSRTDLKELKDEFEKNKKEINAIKQSDSEYRKYRKNFEGSTGEERKEQQAIYAKIRSRLYRTDSNFKRLMDENRKIHSKLNYLTLVQMTADYHKRGEILSTKFIPYADLNRYNENFKVKENLKKITILNMLYKKVVDEEMREKYNIVDSTKTKNQMR